jgi:hypothetical protein
VGIFLEDGPWVSLGGLLIVFEGEGLWNRALSKVRVLCWKLVGFGWS